MSWDETSESVCQVARGLSVFGDRWTLLIMREISLGVRRFEDIQAQTGMSSNLLAMRLKRLEQDEVIERRQYSSHANRFEYYSTQKGKDLDGVLLAIRAWAMRWGGFPPDAEPAVALVYRKTGETIDELWQVPRSKRPFSFADTEGAMSKAFAKERAARAAAFKANRAKPVDKPNRGSATAAKVASKKKAEISDASSRKLVKKAEITAVQTPVRKKATTLRKPATTS